MAKKVVIIGGVAGGASTAARLRRLDEEAEIIMFEKDEYISFANCGLPYHISEVIPQRQKLIVQSPEAMYNRFRIGVRNNSKVVAVDTAKKTVTVESATQGRYQESYDVLVISPGCEPMAPAITGGAPNRTFSLRTIPDTDKIKAYTEDNHIKTAVVAGGGFIGLEMAENLQEKGVNVTLVEFAPHILAPLDDEMVVIAEKEMQDHGVKLVLGDGIKQITDGPDAATITLASGKTLEAQMIIMAIGVRPATDFLQGSGIALGPKGHIQTDSHMRTNIPDVYAVGDAIEVTDFVTGQTVAVPLAGPANKQGRICADNIAGIDRQYKGTQGTCIIKLFSLAAAATGANEKTLKRLGIPYKAIYTHPFSHATYYPNSVQFSAKLLFNMEGKILGCQMIGKDGVDKRMDVVATAMRLGAHVTQLTELELAYAPPFSSAKDPVNMLGYVAQNILEGKGNLVDYHYMLNRDASTTILLDTRTPQEYDLGHIDGAINIPVDALRDRLQELDKTKEIIEYCQVGVRGHVAQRILSNHGFKVVNVSGGWKLFSTLHFKPQA